MYLHLCVLYHVADNRTFKPRVTKSVDFGEFINSSVAISPQQKLAIFQFLSTGSYKPTVSISRVLCLRGCVKIMMQFNKLHQLILS